MFYGSRYPKSLIMQTAKRQRPLVPHTSEVDVRPFECIVPKGFAFVAPPSVDLPLHIKPDITTEDLIDDLEYASVPNKMFTLLGKMYIHEGNFFRFEKLLNAAEFTNGYEFMTLGLYNYLKEHLTRHRWSSQREWVYLQQKSFKALCITQSTA